MHELSMSQAPVQPVSVPPFSQLTVQGSPVVVQSTVQVELPSQTMSQPPPAQLMLHIESLSQSNSQPPPAQS